LEHEVDNPEEELEKVNQAIRRYEVVLRSSSDVDQQDRARHKLRSLRSFRAKLLQGFDLKQKEEETPDSPAEAQRPLGKYLTLIVKRGRQEEITDPEAYHLSLYLDFYEQEFLTIFSERKLRLDFQHSLERDGFYHRFQEVRRKLDDFKHELDRIHEGDHSRAEQIEMRKRSMKMKRVFAVEMNKLLKSVIGFTETLLEDIAKDGLICLNGFDPVEFDEIEGVRYLEGKTVQESLNIIYECSLEILAYLNIPEFNS
jgi:hypothetical protein